MVSSDFEDYRQAKEQIAQLEAEMAEFRASSRELEQELELELEESEERHKNSQMKINELTLELDQVKVSKPPIYRHHLKLNFIHLFFCFFSMALLQVVTVSTDTMKP